MEVFVGPTFTINVPDQTGEDLPTAFRISGPPKFFTGGSPESSSSIGTPDDSDNDEEVQSELKGRNGLGSLDSLEDSLPIKFVSFSITPFHSSFFLFWVAKKKSIFFKKNLSWFFGVLSFLICFHVLD
jgi:hypothetical protein